MHLELSWCLQCWGCCSLPSWLLKKKRGRQDRIEGQTGDKVKNKFAREHRENAEAFSYYTGDTLNGARNQDMWEGGDEWQSELVIVEEDWRMEGGEGDVTEVEKEKDCTVAGGKRGLVVGVCSSNRVMKIKEKTKNKGEQEGRDRWRVWCPCQHVPFYLCELLQIWEGHRARGRVNRGLTGHLSPPLWLKYHQRIQFVSPVQTENLLVSHVMKGEPGT